MVRIMKPGTPTYHRVRGANKDGLWHETDVRLVIKPNPWLPLYVILGLSGFGIAGFIVWKRLQERDEERERQRREREDRIRADAKGKTILFDPQGKVLHDSLKQEDVHFFERVEAVIRDNLSREDFNVEALAEEVALSPRQLRRKIHELTKGAYTLKRLIDDRRMARAKVLLEQKDWPIAAIAGEVGFSSPSYFAKKFRTAFDKSPSEFRAENRNKNHSASSDTAS